jgi:4-amino-4-deoxy-L-arabinose transferase-like glycosyltransferase
VSLAAAILPSAGADTCLQLPYNPRMLTPLTPSERRAALWLGATAVLVLAAGFGLRDPWPADEPRFVLVAKQMVESGDWLFPQRGSELYPDKPPFYFWLLALAGLATGSWRWSFLLPSLLAGLGTLWLVFDLARRLWNARAGLWAAAAVLAVPAFVYQAKRAQIDPTLVFLTTLALYGILRHLLLGPAWRWFVGGCFAAGLGVISKGVGFLPLLALLPFAWMRWRGWPGLPAPAPGDGWRWAAGIGAFFGAIALWFVPMLLSALYDGNASHRAYLDDILFKQTATRYLDPWHHHEPAWYFLEVIVLFWAPFALAWPWLARPWRQSFAARDARVWLPLAWALLVIAFFTGSAGKRDMYILPALPGFALAAAPFLDAILQRVGVRRALLGYTVLLGGLLAAAGVAALVAEPRFAQKLVEERGLGAEQAWLWGMLVAVGATGLLAALVLRVRGAAKACAVLLVALWLGWGLVVHPLLDRENSARGVMEDARAAAGATTEIGLLGWKEQNLLQAVGPVREFGFCKSDDDLECHGRQRARALAWLAESPATRALFVRRMDAYACFDFALPHAQPIGVANRREWWLLRAGAVTPACAATTEAIDGR